MKKLLFLSALAISALCSAQEQTAHQFIPKDASIVISLNSAITLDKINLDEIKELEVMQEMITSIKRGAGEDSSVIETLWNKSRKYGLTLNPSSQIFMDFREGEYSPDVLVGVVSPLKTGKKFDKLMKLLLDEEFEDFVETEGDYKYYYKREMAVAWSKTYMICVFFDGAKPEEMAVEIKNIMTMPKDSSIIANASFSAETTGKSDIEMYINADEILKMNKSMKRMFDPSAFTEFRGKEAFYSIDFLDGVIDIRAAGPLPKEQLEALRNISNAEANPELLKWVDNDAPVCLWNNSNIYNGRNYLLENHPEIADSLKALADRALIKNRIAEDSSVIKLKEIMWADSTTWEQRKEYRATLSDIKDSLRTVFDSTNQDYQSEKLAKYGLERDDIWKLFRGDVYAAIYGTTETIDTFKTYDYATDEDGEYKYLEVEKTRIKKLPVFKVLGTSDAPDKLSGILDVLVEDEELAKEEGQDYYTKIEGKQTMYLAINQGIYCFTNDKSFIEEFLNGAPSKEASDAGELIDLNGELVDFRTLVQKRSFTTHVNFELLIEMIQDESTSKIFDEVNGLLSSFNANSHITDKHEFQSRIKLKGNRNSLHLIADMVNSMYLMFATNGANY